MERQRQAGYPSIAVVTCVYVNPETDRFWIIDYRIFAPETDHKSKLDHMREMLTNAVDHKRLSFCVALMDSWYAAKDEMLFIERLGKIYYCPIKDNRLVSLSRKDERYIAWIACCGRKTNYVPDGWCVCATSLPDIR